MNAPGISTDFLKDCPSLKLLQSTFAGYDNVDIKSINDMRIALANNDGGNAIRVAEFTMGLINGVTRGVFRSVQNARAGNWNNGLREHPTWKLTSKCVGNIGQRVAQMLTRYECDTVYIKRTWVSAEREQELHARYLPPDELLQVAAFVTIHTALNQGSRGMIGKEQLALMKPTAVIINTTRGAVINQEALYDALTNGGIAGAALDVLAEEPTPSDSPFWVLNNVIITPHQSGISQEAVTRSGSFAFANVRRAALGEPIQSLVTPD